MRWFVLNPRAMNAGGFGELFIGRRSDTGEWVVVKYLREFRDLTARRAFAREVRILGRGLPGVVPILFADLTGPRPYYIMPYLPGGALTPWAGRLSADQLVAVATQMATPLIALHAAYVAHGDIKPDNILLTQQGALRVADPLGNGAGCTVLFHENHGGTSGYMAPEICAGRPISKAGDVYSYGATLFHLLTGHRPRDGWRLDQLVAASEGARLIRGVILACCQVDPRARPTMHEVLSMLRGESYDMLRLRRLQKERILTVGGTFVAATWLIATFGR